MRILVSICGGSHTQEHLADYMWERLQEQQRNWEDEREKGRKHFEMTMWRYNRIAERRSHRVNRWLVTVLSQR
jgi:hypothetical protein